MKSVHFWSNLATYLISKCYFIEINHFVAMSWQIVANSDEEIHDINLFFAKLGK